MTLEKKVLNPIKHLCILVPAPFKFCIRFRAIWVKFKYAETAPSYGTIWDKFSNLH